MLRVDWGIPNHFVQCLIGEASVGMDLIRVPSQLLEEAVVVLSSARSPRRDAASDPSFARRTIANRFDSPKRLESLLDGH